MRNTLLLVGLFGPTANGAEPFRYGREIDVSFQEGERLVGIRLDVDVLSHAQADLPDLRVLDADDQAVSAIIRTPRVSKSSMTRQSWTARDPRVTVGDDGGLEIEIQLAKDDPVPDGMKIVTPLKNFEQRVRVEQSADGVNWEPAGDATVLFDYSRFFDARNDNISIPGRTARRFRLVIDDVTAEQESQLMELTRSLTDGKESRKERVSVERRPFRIDRIDLWRNVPQTEFDETETTRYPITVHEQIEDAAERRSRIILNSPLVPLTELALQTDSRNFSRRAQLEAETPEGTWRQISAGTITKIALAARDETTLRFTQTRAARYRLTIDNRDSPPVIISGAEGTGPVREVYFLAETGKRYRLAYGSPDARLPEFDTVAIESSLARSRPLMAAMGPEEAVRFVEKPRERRWSDLFNDPRVLLPVMGLLVVVLGLALYRAAISVESIPPEDQNPGGSGEAT
jgi:hypothetical protein